MQEKKFDINSLIGFVLIGAIILWFLNDKKNEVQKDKTDKAQTEQVEQKTEDSSTVAQADTLKATHQRKPETDSVALAKKSEAYGAFAKSAITDTAQSKTTTLENSVLRLKISNKGGQIVEAKLRKETTFDSLPVYIIKDHNALLNLKFLTLDNKTINTKDLHFEPSLTKNGDNTVLTMRLSLAADKYLEYTYTLKPDEYMMDFNIRSHGFKDVINQSQPIDLNWNLKGFHHGKSISYEHRYTRSVWHYEGNKNSSQYTSSKEEDTNKDISWVAYRQHFFSSILLNNSTFEEGTITSKFLAKDEEKDTVFIQDFASTFPLKLKGGELSENLNMYYGPSDYKTLTSYDRNLDEVIPLGWGIFGWINKYAFIPIFNFILTFLPAGLAIILLTIIVKILLSPVQYKQFLSQAKQKVLRPEIDEINDKYKDNQMKRQQETMKLNRKAGINPASGCLVGLIQIPIFYAMFRLFPSMFELRHESFLWAKDLSTYDVIAHLPFNIPLYGDHVSLFPILAAMAIFFYMTLTTGQNMQMQKQPGMPNMKFIMYLSPLFMLIFFNRYPSGLSLYYLTSNLISIAIVLVIKVYIIDDNKIHAKIQENKKKKPKKKNRFQQKMQEMMEEAEKQKKGK